MKPINEMNLSEALDHADHILLWDERGDSVDNVKQVVSHIRDLTRWTPVSERLPDENGYYQVWDTEMALADFKDGNWYGERVVGSKSPALKSKFREVLKPTHWKRIDKPEGV